MTSQSEELFLPISGHPTRFKQPTGFGIVRLRSLSDFFLSPSKLWIFQSFRSILCVLRYLLGVFYGIQGLSMVEIQISIYFLVSTTACVFWDANQILGNDTHWMLPHSPVIVELLSGLNIVIHSAIVLWISNIYVWYDPSRTEQQINGAILPFLILLSVLITYHVYITLEERKSRYRNYRNAVRPVILFTESGDPVAYFPRIGSEIPMLSVDSLLQPQNSEEGMIRD